MMDLQANIATYHHYFVSAFLAEMEKQGECCGDVFGIGEDCLIRALYPYTEIIHHQISAFEQRSDLWRDSAIYEFSHRLSCKVWRDIHQAGAPLLEAKLPSESLFEVRVRDLLNSIQ